MKIEYFDKSFREIDDQSDGGGGGGGGWGDFGLR